MFTSSSKKWAIQETPNLPEAEASSLAGVSCKSATACIAVGRGTGGASFEAALLEEYA